MDDAVWVLIEWFSFIALMLVFVVTFYLMGRTDGFKKGFRKGTEQYQET